jgi:Glutamine amidotransferase domain
MPGPATVRRPRSSTGATSGRLKLRTACDGEVIPLLWAKLGPESLAELRGMFAVALVDALVVTDEKGESGCRSGI